MEFILNYICGFYFGPLMTMIEFLPFRTYQQNAAAELGFASSVMLALVVWYPWLASVQDFPTWLDLVAFTAGMFILAFIIVKISRYSRLGVVEKARKSVGVFYQVVVFTTRGALQQIRNWKGKLIMLSIVQIVTTLMLSAAFTFDLGVVFVAGTFLGLVFGGRPYKVILIY